MASFSEIVEEARLSARALLDYGDNLFNPTVRLGVSSISAVTTLPSAARGARTTPNGVAAGVPSGQFAPRSDDALD